MTDTLDDVLKTVIELNDVLIKKKVCPMHAISALAIAKAHAIMRMGPSYAIHNEHAKVKK